MTYSHNSVRNNIKMTTASATKSIRLKKGTAAAAASGGGGVGGGGVVNGSGGGAGAASTLIHSSSTPLTPSSSTTTLVTAHSNSIASSTNFNSNPHFQQALGLGLTSTPYGLAAVLGTPNNNNNTHHHRQRSQHSQSAPQTRRHQQGGQPQRYSPQQTSSTGGGAFFFANNSRRNTGGSGLVASPRSPPVRQSPATILGGGFTPTNNGIGGGALGSSATRKQQRRSPTISTSANGKVSPQQPLIPTALTHFAGSKCFDAPAPTALPKPPQHWTSFSKSEEKLASSAGPSLQCLLRSGSGSMVSTAGGLGVVKVSKRNLLDEFDTHNLKLLLNVQS